MKATCLKNVSFSISKQTVVSLTVWEVEKDEKFPEGFKYTFVLIHNHERILGRDNHEGKGHHIHRWNQPDEPNPYIDEIRSIYDIRIIQQQFHEEVRKVRKEWGI